MVLGTTLNLELPRRVVVYYLLFCLTTVVWLVAGVVITTRTVIRSRSENSALSQLERVSSKLEIAYLRSGTEGLQGLVEQIRNDSRLAYCAMVGPDERFLAHSTSNQMGKLATEVVGDRKRWGEIECVEYTDLNGKAVCEYRLPLREGDELFATLRMGATRPNALNMILSTAATLPFALLGPIGLLAVGAVVLQRIVRPLSEVDSQLRRVAVTPDPQQVSLNKVRVRGPGSLGWNRLVSELESGALHSDFEERIGVALQTRASNQNDGLLNSLPEGIATTDEAGTIVFANRAFLTYLGRAPDEGIPQNCAVEDCLDLRNIAPDSPFLTLHQTTRSLVTEVKRTSDGGDRYLRLARFPLRTATGQSGSGHVWTIRDITQQKLADKMRDEFLDSATHELRTPLANIRAYAETLALSDMLEIEQQKEFCNTINEEATRLARLIDDLLSVSSMEAGSLAVNRKNTEVERLLRDAANKVRGQMEQKSITFETLFSEKLPEMPLDKDKVSITLVNLLGNAAKYTPEGGRVVLKARVDEAKLLIEIEDTGIGIAKEELPKVFGKFFRSDDARVRAITGTGLGLSMAQEVIRLHGGSLTVHSELDKGTTFTVTLPV